MTEVPRLELARLPTPIDRLEPLGRELGIELFVKRDDLTGAELSGNKVRKLEYVLADALAHRADVVLTCGGAQSNHCRATAIAARRLGLEVELLLRGAESAPVEGNLFLDLLVGARVLPVDAQGYLRRREILAARAEEHAAEGRHAYVIPEGASTPLGALGYVRCAAEIAAAPEGPFDAIVVAVGSGGTIAGLIAGAELHGLAARLVGVPVCDDADHFRHRTDELLDGMRARFLPGLSARAERALFIDGYVGQGYGKASAAELTRLKDVAVVTGLLLDPVYTNKAFGALLDLVRSGRIRRGERVLFLHTGGLFGLLAFKDELRRHGAA